MNKKTLCVVLLLPILLIGQTEKTADVWQPLKFLEGKWEGQGEVHEDLGMFSSDEELEQSFHVVFPGKEFSCFSVNKLKRANPAVYLNHFFLTVDSGTYRDIVESGFIKNELAVFETRTTFASANEYWTGAYVYGENTYFEFFEAEKGAPRSVGDIGVAFGVENEGEIKRVEALLKESVNPNAGHFLRSRKIGEIQIPWFYAMSIFDMKAMAGVMTWIMEYHPDYLLKWYPELKPLSTDITRKNILTRYKAKVVQEDPLPKRLLKDVIELHVVLNATDFERFLSELRAFGYAVKSVGNAKVCIGPGIRIILESGDIKGGRIAHIKMDLHANPVGQISYSFGKKSRLIFHGDKTATWEF